MTDMRDGERKLCLHPLVGCQIEEDMFSADCYLSVISAFLSVTMSRDE